jgi:hypothetical protein
LPGSASLDYAEQLARHAPGDRDIANLMRSLRTELERPNTK